MVNRWGNSGNSGRLYFLGSKITADGDCSQEIKRRLLLERKVMTNLDSIFGEGNGPHSSTLAWKIPWMEEPGRLQSMRSVRLSDFTFTFHFHALEKETAPHSSVLAWRVPGAGELVAAVSGVTQGRTRLKRLSSSGSSIQHIKKQRRYFANKGPSSQGYGFSSGHVWM